jgi:hypothetical protein
MDPQPVQTSHETVIHDRDQPLRTMALSFSSFPPFGCVTLKPSHGLAGLPRINR